MLAAASETISGIVNTMPIPESTQMAVIPRGRLEGEAGSDSGCSVTTFFCLAAVWGIAMAHLGTAYANPIGSASPCGGSRMTVMESGDGWTAPRTASACQDGRCHRAVPLIARVQAREQRIGPAEVR